MAIQNKWTAEFYAPAYNGTPRRIDITYHYDEQGKIAGEAYFTADDLLADIVDGEFVHPMRETRYKFTPVSHNRKGNFAMLEVLAWQTVGTCVPAEAV